MSRRVGSRSPSSTPRPIVECPWASKSTMSTLRPPRARADARAMDVTVLPVPPLWVAIVMVVAGILHNSL